MTTRNRTRTLLTLAAVAILGFITSANAGVFSYVPITNDADSGISTENIYTHILDFGQGAPGALINGVQFDAYNQGANGTLNFERDATNDHAGNGNQNVTGGLADLLRDMFYAHNLPTHTLTLSGLEPGVGYSTRIYTRVWGASTGNRPVIWTFDPDGDGPISDVTPEIKQDDATSVGFADGLQAYYINYEFTALSDKLVITIEHTALPASWHLYGLTNQEFSLESAVKPYPADEATDVIRDADLSWAPGEFAATHDVYVGDSFAEVDTATVPTGPGLDVASFDPGRMELGKTVF